MNLINLRNSISNAFNSSELEVLCYDLSIDPDEISDQTKSIFVTNLILFCFRHGNLQILLERCRLLRPNKVWPNDSILIEKDLEVFQKNINDQTSNVQPNSQTNQGDVFQVKIDTVGSEAQVAIGKNIEQYQGIVNDKLRELIEPLLGAIISQESGENQIKSKRELNNFRNELATEEPNLEKIQSAKTYFESRGGRIKNAVQDLFKQEQIKALLQTAAEISIKKTLENLTS